MPSPTRWLALLPASKGVHEGGTGPTWSEVAAGPAAELLDRLGDDDREQDTVVGARPTTAAWQRYDGAVHRAADPGSLTGQDRRRWHRHVAYVSALAGLVRSTDPLPAYRLEMQRVVDGIGGLGPWWRPHVAALLDEALTAGATVWLLTGGEYARAVEVPGDRTVHEPRFLRAEGTRSMPSATVKQARGQLARALVTHPTLAKDPTDAAWADVVLTTVGTTVHLDTVEDGTQVWREAG